MSVDWRAVLYIWVTWMLGMAAGAFAAAGADVETRMFLVTVGLMVGFLWSMNMVRGGGE